MRVTCAMREYVRKAVLDKVADKLKSAEDARAAAIAARDAKVGEARKLCEEICAEAQAKFVREVKKSLGLTYIPHTYWVGGKVDENGNRAMTVSIGRCDFAETMDSSHCAAKFYPCAARDEFYRIVGEPDRIREAAASAADKLLFELELGKVAKKELDETLKGLEVEI